MANQVGGLLSCSFNICGIIAGKLLDKLIKMGNLLVGMQKMNLLKETKKTIETTLLLRERRLQPRTHSLYTPPTVYIIVHFNSFCFMIGQTQLIKLIPLLTTLFNRDFIPPNQNYESFTQTQIFLNYPSDALTATALSCISQITFIRASLNPKNLENPILEFHCFVIPLLLRTTDSVLEQAARTLCNIFLYFPGTTDEAIKNSSLLLNMLNMLSRNSLKISALRNATMIVRIIFKTSLLPDNGIEQITKRMGSILYVKDEESEINSMWGLAYLCEQIKFIRFIVIHVKFEKIIKMACSKKKDVNEPALIAIGYISANTHEAVDKLIQAGALSGLKKILRQYKPIFDGNNHRLLLQFACSILSNIFAFPNNIQFGLE